MINARAPASLLDLCLLYCHRNVVWKAKKRSELSKIYSGDKRKARTSASERQVELGAVESWKQMPGKKLKGLSSCSQSLLWRKDVIKES